MVIYLKDISIFVFDYQVSLSFSSIVLYLVDIFKKRKFENWKTLIYRSRQTTWARAGPV